VSPKLPKEWRFNVITIKNLRHEQPTEPWDVKVDRSTWFGNGFKMKDESERDNVCDQWKEMFYDELYDSVMQAELAILYDIYCAFGKLNLFCWCAPKRCHAETLRDYLMRRDEINEKEKKTVSANLDDEMKG